MNFLILFLLTLSSNSFREKLPSTNIYFPSNHAFLFLYSENFIDLLFITGVPRSTLLGKVYSIIKEIVSSVTQSEIIAQINHILNNNLTKSSKLLIKN